MRTRPIRRATGAVWQGQRWYTRVATLVLILYSAGHLGLLLLNAVRVPPTYGYDWPGHLTYLYHVADSWRPPPPAVSAGFHNTPIYYYCVATLHRAAGVPLLYAGLVLNFGLALLTFGLWLSLSWRLWDGDPVPVAWSVVLYVCQPAVYRTFGMVRPEALLMPLFTIAGWLVVWASERESHWALIGAGGGLLAGLAFGTRQWGAFLAAALGIWMVLREPGRLWQSARRWGSVSLHALLFVALSWWSLSLRGGGPLDFNTSPHRPDVSFWIRLGVPEILRNPVRPVLGNTFWPVLYADAWGDYWRYWREALMHDPLSSSPATVAALSRGLWAALPVTSLIVVGWWSGPVSGATRRDFHRWTRILTLVAVGGYALFSGMYADPSKGDTVKAVYLAYLAPYLAWLGASAASRLRDAVAWGAGVAWLSLVLITVFVLPTAVYVAPERMQSHTWGEPDLDHRLMGEFGEAITLVGYRDLCWDVESGELVVDLVWRADGYSGRSYKVFVHLVSSEEHLLAQSDAIPAQWHRPTEAWMLGEYVEDGHRLKVTEPRVVSGGALRVGVYDKLDGSRLELDDGEVYVSVAVPASLAQCGVDPDTH